MQTETPTPVTVKRRPLSLRAKLVIGFTLLSAGVSFLTARGMYTNLQNQITNEFNERVKSLANLTALQQNGADFVQISSSTDELYETFQAQNLKILVSDPEIRAIRTLRKDAEGIYFVTSVSATGTQNNATFGERLTTPSTTLTASFDDPSETLVEPALTIDETGSYLTAYTAILNASGEQVGVLSVDYLADTVTEQRRQIVSQATLVFIVALGLGMFFGYVAGNSLTEPVVKLTTGATAFATGDFSQRIDIDTGDEIENLANTFNNMAGDLQGLITGLEERVAERTQDLESRSAELEVANTRILRRAAQFEALAQVTQSITAIRDLTDLLPRITGVISEKFGFYHVGIFLLDEINEYAVLSAANSAGGQRMLERKHRLRVGAEGIVGFVAMNAKPRIAMDVGTDATFFNNPDLPDTHSEIGLPLISKNIIVGVLDVQSTEIGAFSDEDIQMLSLLADQVSLAIENARLFDETRRALAESEMMTRRTMREAWSRLPEKIKLRGYRYNVTGAVPLIDPIALPNASSGGKKAEETEANQTVVPIAIRGEVLGKLVVQSPTSQPWNQDQLDIIQAVAERVALSAENARLFDETTARAERERLVSEITGKIRSHNDPQAMIQTAMDELRAALGASRVEIVPQQPGQTAPENRQVKS